MNASRYFFPEQARAHVQRQYTRAWELFEEHLWSVFRHIENEAKLGKTKTVYAVTPQLTETGSILPLEHLKRYIANQLRAIRYDVQDANKNLLIISWDDETINRKPPVPQPTNNLVRRQPVTTTVPPQPTTAPATMPPNARPLSIPHYTSASGTRRAKSAVPPIPTRVLKLD